MNAGKPNEGANIQSESAELYVTQKIPSINLTLNLESGALFPLALRLVNKLSLSCFF